MNGRLRALLLAAAALALPGRGSATESILAVLSSEAGPYREALKGLQEGVGAPVPSIVLAAGEVELPRSARVVVAFGSRAASLRYPKGVTLVYALAPTAAVGAERAVEVAMAPSPATLIAGLRRLQPGLRRLGVLWVSGRLEPYVKDLREAAAGAGLALEARPAAGETGVPDGLRWLHTRVDALWLPPDPPLFSAENLAVLVAFSRDNRVPLYVPAGGLVAEGATASVGADFRAIGRLAGSVAQGALRGEQLEARVYPSAAHVVVNPRAAARIGLELPKAALEAADEVLP